jgi:hypothetical protein
VWQGPLIHNAPEFLTLPRPLCCPPAAVRAAGDAQGRGARRRPFVLLALAQARRPASHQLGGRGAFRPLERESRAARTCVACVYAPRHGLQSLSRDWVGVALRPGFAPSSALYLTNVRALLGGAESSPFFSPSPKPKEPQKDAPLHNNIIKDLVAAARPRRRRRSDDVDGGAAMQKSRIVTLGFGTARQRLVLERWTSAQTPTAYA